MLALVAAASVFLATVSAQPVPLPNSPDGYLRLGSPTAQVTLDAFVDLLCPDCAAAWPTLKAVSAHYSPTQLQIVVHLFPLPYHTNAFMTAYTGNVITSLNASGAFGWVDALFNGAQQNFWNDATQNMTAPQLASALASLAASTSGVSAAAVLAGLTDPNLNENTRISWKYACSRSVTGTPSLFVNNLPVAADSSWTLAQWTALLDPLFAAGGRTKRVQLSGFRDAHFAARGPLA